MKKAILIILDGWGIGSGDHTDAVAQARTPFIDSLINSSPSAQLRTDGEYVGLPHGQMGNSEVGHLNIGAGRIVNQELVRISRSIEDGTLQKNKVLQDAFMVAKERGCKLHFMGLVSDGGVHSSQEHLHALLKMAAESEIPSVHVHAFLDGRDTDPNGGIGYLEELNEHLQSTGAQLATVIGRYYAMDRDKRWERVKRAYDLLVNGEGTKSTNALRTVQEYYDKGISDEFMEPIVATDAGSIEENDVVICFNYRTDRCREITQALTQIDMPEYGMHTLPLHYVTMTEYDATYKGVHVLFTKSNLENTLGEIISKAGKNQIRIAETEKYPHVTFFFSGGREQPFENEKRIIVSSPKVATYDLQPEMSAPEVTDTICKELAKGDADFVCLNFANPDMVGHTGVFDAIVKAVETTDSCTKQVVDTARSNNYQVVIIADHGNADMAINPDGTPHTAHTTNPVSIIVLSPDRFDVEDGILADVAPTILDLMALEQPTEMTGRSLLSRS
jgi:2,3-bisphosphoglycerate-independent phosphoglycerate mutase